MVILVVTTLLASLSSVSGFVPTQDFRSPSSQAHRRLRPTTLAGRDAGTPPTRRLYLPICTQKALAVHFVQPISATNIIPVAGSHADGARFSLVTPVGVSGMNGDDIDPLEAGPDPQLQDFNVRSQAGDVEDDEEDQEDDEGTGDVDTEVDENSTRTKRGRGRPSRRSVPEDRSDAASMSGLAGLVSAQRNSGVKRRRRDPLMPRGAPDPVDWTQIGDMKEGGRAHLVIYHSGFEEDKVRAAKLTKMVSDRYGHLVNICEFGLDEEDMTDDERRDSNLFEVFLAGLDQVHYHSRAECWSEMTDEHMAAITEDIGSRVSDEALMLVDVSHLPEYEMPGISFMELMQKYPPL